MLPQLFLSLFLFIGISLADSPNSTPKEGVKSPASEVIDIQFLVVHATVAHSDIDAELRPLMPYFENYKYTGFNLINTKSAQLKNKDKKQFVIQGNRRITITVLSHDDTKARMKLTMVGVKGRVLLDTTILVNRNGTFIVAGPKFKDGILVLPITANF